MALKTMIENLRATRAAYDAQLAAIGDEAAKGIAEAIAEHVPPGSYVGWSQYAPHFNDGKPSTFSVNGAYLARLPGDRKFERSAENIEGSIELERDVSRYGLPDEQYDAQGYGGKTYRATRYGIPLFEGLSGEALTALAELWKSLPEDLLKRAFGADTGVRVVRELDGAVSHECTYYEHD